MFIKLYNWVTGENYQKVRKAYNHRINGDVAVVPLGGSNGASISNYVRRVAKILARAGFDEVETHGFGTNVSGDLQTFTKTVAKIAQDTMENSSVPRVALSLKLSLRKDKHDQSIAKRLAAVR